jgi:PAS domain S-box-containing protein
MTQHPSAGKTSDSHPNDKGEHPGRERRTWPAHLLPGGIRERLFLLIVLAAVPVLILQGWTYYNRYVTRRDQALQTEFEVARGVATTFASYIDGVWRQLDTVGQEIITVDPSAEWDTERRTDRLLETIDYRYATIRSASWVSPDGRVLASTSPGAIGRDVSAQQYFQQALSGVPWAISDLLPIGTVIERPLVGMAVAIQDEDGVLHGVIVAGIEPARIGEVAFVRWRPAGGAFSLFDSQGILVYRHPETPLSWEQRSQWLQDDPLLPSALVGRAAQGEITSPIAGDRRFAARVPIPEIGWVAGASRPVAIVMAPVRQDLLRESMLGIMVASLALLLASLLARTIAEPLRRLERDAHAMGTGEIPASTDSQAPNEVYSLRAAMTGMAAGLIDRAAALRQANTLLQEQTEELQVQSEELRAANEALTHSEQRYRKLFEANLAGTYLTKPDGTIIDFNDAMMRMLGYDSREDVFQHRSTDFYADPAYRAELIQRLRNDGIVPGNEAVLCRKDGSTLYALGYAVLLTDPQTGEPYIQGVAVDITDRKRAEQAVRESEERLSTIFNSVHDAIFIHTFDQRILDVNDKMLEMYGVSKEEALHSYKLLEFADPSKTALAEEIWRDVLAGHPRLIEWTGRNARTGRVFPTEVFLRRIEYGGQEAILATVRDISERKQAEEALRRSEEWFRTLADAMPQLVWTAEPDGRVDYYNQRYKEFQGIEPIADGSFQWAPVLHEDDVAPTVEAWERAVRKGETYQIEHRVQRADGSYHWYLSRGTPVRDAEGRIVKWFGTATDIDDVKQAQEALQELTKTLETRVAQRTRELEHRARQLQKLTLELSQAEDRERKASGGHPARRPPAAACGGEVPPGPAGQPGPRRRRGA